MSKLQVKSGQVERRDISVKVKNKAWKPGVARPSKSKARWMNTTNKMQVCTFFLLLLVMVISWRKSKTRWVNATNKRCCFNIVVVVVVDVVDVVVVVVVVVAIVTVSGQHCSWGEYPETASKQQRCSQVPFSPLFSLSTCYLSIFSGFQKKAQKKQETARIVTVEYPK